MNPTETPNQETSQRTFKIGQWTCYPFSLQTAILLERIGSPFMRPPQIDPATNKPVAVVPSVGEIAEALYVMLNWEKPWINEVVGDELRFHNEVGNLASKITMRDFAQITVQLNDMMATLNSAVTESGIPQGDEKKDEIGSSAS